MNIEIPELLYKGLSVCILPGLIWMNSISVDVALLNHRTIKQWIQISALETKQRAIHDGVKDNQAALRELNVTMSFIKDILDDIKEELKK